MVTPESQMTMEHIFQDDHPYIYQMLLVIMGQYQYLHLDIIQDDLYSICLM